MSKNTRILSIIAAKRGRNQVLSDVERALIVQKMDTGGTLRTVVAEAKCSPPRKLTVQEIRYVLVSLKRDRRITYESLLSHLGANISRTTIRRVIRFHYGRK
jgi:hypothetical protein